jgi:hypothetical protein
MTTRVLLGIKFFEQFLKLTTKGTFLWSLDEIGFVTGELKMCYSFWWIWFCLFVLLGFTAHRHSNGHMARFQLYWWRKTLGALPWITGTWVEPPTFRKLDSFLTWNNPNSLLGFEPKAVSGKWLEVNYLNHSATDAPGGFGMNNSVIQVEELQLASCC